VKARLLDDAVTGLAALVTLAAVDEVDPGLVVEDPDPVEVVVGGTVVVVVEPPPATAMTGAIGAAVGVSVVAPLGVTMLFGYAVHVRLNAWPATVKDRVAFVSSWIVMALLVAENPPTVAGVSGTMNGTSAVTGFGNVMVKVDGPTGVVAGVAPLASIWKVAWPLNVGAMAEAAMANDDGSKTEVWYPVRLNDWPDVGAAGESVAFVTTPLRAIVPMGVPGQ
jgi:hypothetical protein